MINKIFYFILTSLLLASCSEPSDSSEANIEDDSVVSVKPIELTPNEIVAKSYIFHGCEKINSESITFDFRKFHFEYLHTDTGVVRIRSFQDSLGNEIQDVWSRLTLERFENGEVMSISKEKEQAYMSSVNSIFYFAFLPKSLRDPAVNLEYIDTANMKGHQYHKIRVTFDQEGGGEDHEDVFMYWFDLENYSMDYLAYSYETDGGGMRFRASTNRKKIEGIVFQDYLNFAPPEGAKLEDLDSLYNEDMLKQVSVIEQGNIKVKKD